MADLESIQFVAFPKAAATLDAGALWNQALPSNPFTNFSTMSPGHTSAAAAISGIMIEIQSQPLRVDLFMTGNVPSYAMPQTLPSLASFQAAVAVGRTAFVKLLPLQDLSRLAVVVQAHENATGEDDAVAKFGAAVPFNLKNGARDANFQINVRKDSSIQNGLKLNRLCRWATASMINLGFRPASPFSGPVQLPVQQIYTLQSYIDVNTAPDSALDQNLRIALLDELVTEAESVFNGGYLAL